MNVNIKFSGATEKILDEAVAQGYAATKTEALRLGVLELNNKYKLLEEAEEKEDEALAREVLEKIKTGKSKLGTESELWKKLRE